MAVQAQYPSIASRNAYLNNNTVLENFHQDHHLQYGQEVLLLNKGTVFSDPESELTCNFVVSASTTTRKRKTTTTTTSTRVEDEDQMPPHQLNPHQENVTISSSHNYNYNYNYNYFPSSRTTKLPKFDDVEENRLNQSGGGAASTSGRRRRRIRRSSSRYHDEDEEEEDHHAVLPQLVTPLPHHHHSQQYLNSSYYLLHQNLDDEIDALIRLQNETLRSVVEQTQQRQCRLLMSVLEQQVQRRLKEKQIELENAWCRNAELQEKVKQMSSENQMWFNVAKNNEAMVLSLRSTLEQQLLNLHLNQNTTMGLGGGGQGQGQGAKLVEEGFGDSSDGVTDDAQSSNNKNCHHEELLLLQVNVGEREYKTVSRSSNVDVRDHDDDAFMMKQQLQQHRKMCKVCKEMEVSVLLLPCKHLCLCKDCEAKLQACPICKSFKNASLQIFMS